MTVVERWIEDPCEVNSLRITPEADASRGRIAWDPAQSLWNGGMTAAALICAPLVFSWSGLAVFVVLTGALILTGHSVGYHRRLIHRSFECPLWVEHALVYAGVLAGMAGPLGIIRSHDMRDWAQRRATCHEALRNGGGAWRDYWNSLHARLVLDRPPIFAPPETVARDRFYRFLERTWMLHQLPVALVLYVAGGWSWVVWGVCVRIAATVTGHWWVGHVAHNRGPQTWLVDGAGVQAHDVPWAAWLTMGEAWHNNHHAWPGSARIGLYRGQADWGWLFIRLLERLGLAWGVRTPERMPPRPLTAVEAGR